MDLITTNPATGEELKRYPLMSTDQLSVIIENVNSAFQTWRKTDFSYREMLMGQFADCLRDNKASLGLLMTQEMGKPLTASIAEVEKCALLCEHYRANARHYLQDKVIKTEAHNSFVTYQPRGPVFAIMPWNFPTWQVLRFLVPCLMAGNVGLLSHAEISTGTALAIEKLVQEAEFPENVFRTLITDNEGSASVIENPLVTAVTLTGSERAGSAVASTAGKVLKKAVMELGGSDPYLILNDADLELAAEQIVLSRMNVSGQVCIAAKRIIATREVMPKLQALILEKLKRFQMGDPSDKDCNFGPLAREDLRETLHRQVTDSIEKGAKLVTGGVIPEGPGFYYPPTVLTNVSKGMAAFEQELFGPVVVFIEVSDEREGIKVANDTPYGLGAAIFSKDLERGESLARDELEAGAVFVNGLVSSDPRLPFGGIKLSGFGRELSEEGIKEFVNTKTVVVK